MKTTQRSYIMSESNKPSFSEKLKSMNVNRTAVVGACVLLVAVIVIVSIAIATNRAKKNEVELPNTPETSKNTAETTVPETTAPETSVEETQKPAVNDPSSQVQNKLPSFVLPVSGVISKKHDPSLQVFSNTMKDYRVHLGIDVVTESAAPVYAAADGKVDKIWEDALMGNCIAIKHSGDCYTIYKNLAVELPEGIAEGTSVRAGQMIATVGESAMVEVAEEPHLHFEMTVADLSVNPLEYFDEKALETLKIDASYEQ